jgi:hypothetical protein
MTRILIGAPVHQDVRVFEHYLASLNSLEHEYEVDKFFILHNSSGLKDLLQAHEYEDYTNNTSYRKDSTHHWGAKNLQDVVNMKNYLLHKALTEKYDYFFLVDSDIILHPKTLVTLINHRKHIISEVFWTRWTPQEPEMPNAWMYDHYGYEYTGEWDQWRTPSVYKVGYTGACILIHRSVIESGVTYTSIPNVSWSTWEDRAFCIRAQCAGYNIYMDTHHPAKHLYRHEDLVEYEDSLRKEQSTYITKVIKQGR